MCHCSGGMALPRGRISHIGVLNRTSMSRSAVTTVLGVVIAVRAYFSYQNSLDGQKNKLSGDALRMDSLRGSFKCRLEQILIRRDHNRLR